MWQCLLSGSEMSAALKEAWIPEKLLKESVWPRSRAEEEIIRVIGLWGALQEIWCPCMWVCGGQWYLHVQYVQRCALRLVRNMSRTIRSLSNTHGHDTVLAGSEEHASLRDCSCAQFGPEMGYSLHLRVSPILIKWLPIPEDGADTS